MPLPCIRITLTLSFLSPFGSRVSSEHRPFIFTPAISNNGIVPGFKHGHKLAVLPSRRLHQRHLVSTINPFLPYPEVYYAGRTRRDSQHEYEYLLPAFLPFQQGLS
jgi:hypothetical protein